MQSSKANDLNQAYQRLGRRRLAVIMTLVILVTGSLFLDVITGPAPLSLSDVLTTLFQPGAVNEANRTIVWTFRIPTALMAIFVGAALGIAGAEMQTVLNNPLASPYTLGVSAAASFGAALALVLGSGTLIWTTTVFVPTSAFVCAMCCSLAIFAIGRLRGASTETIIVGGVALHFIFSSGVAFLQYMASEDTLAAIVFWIFGTLQGASWHKLAIIVVVMVVTMGLLMSRVWQLTALRLGESHARSLGINTERLRLQTLILVSILTATAVCFTGAIGFVGLLAPHLARMLVGEDQRYFIPLSALSGALLVSVAALVTKLLIPGTIFPIGIATAAIGAPCFAAIALLRRRSYW
ncbi:FecCD family ABC transporter permease [Gimesia algae]|uniref:Hemin transport system permease protein HmuU n=1 Tax=Gimesia algae TaxID=2527971 RepID=A0A517VAJ8_9PLAN|nr:iron ABC transporter permease [Gimesia algae]QDT90034.1 Hemin transport system permease protein HmuU [Gimesia algae]